MVLQQGVSSPPNESIIHGRILLIKKEQEGNGYNWEVKVLESNNVNGYVNFSLRYLGKVITIMIHPEMKKVFNEGDQIIAHILFRGDERGGAFFLVGNKVQKLKPRE